MTQGDIIKNSGEAMIVDCINHLHRIRKNLDPSNAYTTAKVRKLYQARELLQEIAEDDFHRNIGAKSLSSKPLECVENDE